MYQIILSKNSEKFLRKIQTKHAKQIAVKIKSLSIDINQHDDKKLKGLLKDFYRVDVGEFRIIYRFDDTSIYIVLVGKRNDNEVYRQMLNKID